jgi:hypothetical protein
MERDLMAAASEVSLHTTWEVSISQSRRISRKKRMVRPVESEKPVKDDENTGLFVSQIADHAKNLVRCFSILS